MNKADVIRMAREAGFSQPWTAPKETQERLERFAALVTAAKQRRLHAENAQLLEQNTLLDAKLAELERVNAQLLEALERARRQQ